MARERGKIQWIPMERGMPPLSFSTLLLERVVTPERPVTYIDCTYCDRVTLEKLMDVKVGNQGNFSMLFGNYAEVNSRDTSSA